jgi:O-antigen ligase
MGFYAALGFMFFRFSDVTNFLYTSLGFNTYPLYIFGLPAIAAVFMSGGLRRAFSLKCGWYWLGYLVWLVLCIPFSFWPGGAFFVVLAYARTQWLTFFLIAGLVMTWRECWLLINMLSLSGMVAVAEGKFFAYQTVGRTQLSTGTYGNANDFAALLILMCPFIALVIFTPKRNLIVRVIAVFFLLYGLYLILATGSRGGLVATVIAAAYLLTKVSMRVRIGALIGFCAAGVVLVPVLSDSIRTRLTTVFANTDIGAAESATTRRELMKKAALYTLTHPLFGVGPGQFLYYNGTETHREGGSGIWFETHNTYLQVSSENGIPALIFFLAALMSTFRLMNRIYKRTKGVVTRELKNLHMSAFYMLVSMVGFCVALFFLNFAYMFQFPAMTGIAMVLATVAEQEFGIPVLVARVRPGVQAA